VWPKYSKRRAEHMYDYHGGFCALHCVMLWSRSPAAKQQQQQQSFPPVRYGRGNAEGCVCEVFPSQRLLMRTRESAQRSPRMCTTPHGSWGLFSRHDDMATSLFLESEPSFFFLLFCIPTTPRLTETPHSQSKPRHVASCVCTVLDRCYAHQPHSPPPFFRPYTSWRETPPEALEAPVRM
jgi:hypothetical protein